MTTSLFSNLVPFRLTCIKVFLIKMFKIISCMYLNILRILLVCKLICVTWHSCQPLTHFASITNTANANKGCFDEATCISSKSHTEFDGTMQCKIGHSLS